MSRPSTKPSPPSTRPSDARGRRSSAFVREDSTSVSALRLFERLPRHPIVTIASAMKLLDTSKPTANPRDRSAGRDRHPRGNDLVEATGKKRDRRPRSAAKRRHFVELPFFARGSHRNKPGRSLTAAQERACTPSAGSIQTL